MTPVSIPAARAAAAIIATAALALLAACGGSASSTGSGSSASSGSSAAAGGAAVSYTHCMRSHGLPNYPDPDSSGTLPKASAQLLGVSSSVFDAAQRACQQVLDRKSVV